MGAGEGFIVGEEKKMNRLKNDLFDKGKLVFIPLAGQRVGEKWWPLRVFFFNQLMSSFEKIENKPPQPPPVDRLYRHALESIFVFLSLKELNSVLSVSRSWSAAVASMRAVDAVAHCSGFTQRFSRLARHVVTLGSESCPVNFNSAVSLYMTRLQSLYYRPKYPELLPMTFPPSLSLLHVAMRYKTTTFKINKMIIEASRVAGLQSFVLRVEEQGHSFSLDLSPLVLLRHLRTLRLVPCPIHPRLQHLFDSWEFKLEQLDQMRALSQLTSLECFLAASELKQLLRAPHRLQLQHIQTLGALDEEASDLLSNLLPSLTHVSMHASTSVVLLQHVPDVRILTLDYLGNDSFDSVPIKKHMHLTHLNITQNSITAANLAALLARIPAITKLVLSRTSLESLAFFSESASLQRSLTSFTIENKHFQLPPEELRHVFALQQLTHLRIQLRKPIDPLLVHELQAPSNRLPKLICSEVYDRVSHTNNK